MSSAWPHANLHLYLSPDRQPCQHPTTQFLTGRIPFLLPNKQMKCCRLWDLTQNTDRNENQFLEIVNLTINTHTIVLLLFWNMSETTRVSRYQKGKTRKSKTNLDLLEQEIVSDSGICWAICKSAPHPRQPCQHPTNLTININDNRFFDYCFTLLYIRCRFAYSPADATATHYLLLQ